MYIYIIRIIQDEARTISHTGETGGVRFPVAIRKREFMDSLENCVCYTIAHKSSYSTMNDTRGRLSVRLQDTAVSKLSFLNLCSITVIHAPLIVIVIDALKIDTP